MANKPLKSIRFPGLPHTYTIPQIDETEINRKVSKPANNPDGTAGQVLRTNGDGTTTWASVGLPTDEQTAEAVSDWLNAHPEATTTVQDGAVTSAKLANALTIAKIDSYVTPQQYGAVGDGVADDTSAFASMENSAKSIVYIPEGVYKISGWTTAKSVIMDDRAWLTTDTDKADVITINGDDQVYALNLRLKDTYAHYGVKINGDRNHFKMIRIDGLNYDGVTLYPNNKINAGVAVFGTFNTFDFVKLNDFVQDYAGNDSAPQGFVFGDTANYNYLADYHINNCRAGVVSAGLAGTVNRIGSMAVHGCGDNGLYCVGGGHTEVGTFFHQGTNECLAVITDGATASTLNSELTNVQVGTIICKCNTGFSFPVRIKNAGEIKIGSLFVNGEVEAIIFSNRDTIKNAGIDIANLVFDGTARFAFFLPAERGPLDYLMIGRAIIKDNHADSSSSIIGDANYMIVDMAQKITIDRLDLTILDKEGTYTSQSLRPRIILNSALVDSFIGRVTCEKPSNASGLRLDIINAVQDGITHTHGYFQYNDAENKITHYSNNRYSDVLYSRLSPQYGAWKAGVIVHTDREQTVGEGVVGFVCTVSGTPGTWRELRVFPSSSIVRYYNNKLQYSKYENGSLTWVDVPTT